MMFARRGACAAVLGALLVAAPVQRAAAGNGGGTVGVMTMNIYVGTDTNSLLSAQTQEGLALAVTTAYQNILKTNPAERIAVMAREIARRNPVLVGLQEVALLRTGPSTSPATPATNVEIDFLQRLLDDLAKLGRHYDVAAILPGLDAQAASLIGRDIRLTGRTVIIARTGARLANLQVEDFLTNLRVSTPIPDHAAVAASFSLAGSTQTAQH